MNIEKLLPLGTVVTISGDKKRIMIVGYYSGKGINSDKKICDYIGCYYPYGLSSENKLTVFDHEDIRIIYFMGFSDLEAQLYIKTLKSEYEILMKKISNDKNKK